MLHCGPLVLVVSYLLLKKSLQEPISSTIVYAQCVNKQTNASAVLCGNYQLGSRVAKHLEEGPAYRLAFWPQNDDHWCSVPGEEVSFVGKAVFGKLKPINGSACPNSGADVNMRLDALKSRGGEVAVFEEGPLSRWYGNPYVNISRFNGSVLYFDSPSIQEMGRLYRNNRNESGDVELRFYTSEEMSFNVAYFLNVFVPTLCVILGGLWSGRAHEPMSFPTARRKRPTAKDTFSTGDGEDADNQASPKQKSGPSQEEINRINGVGIAIVGGLTVSLILLLYFFYDYLIWIFLVFYVVGSAESLYRCLMLVIARSPLLEHGSSVPHTSNSFCPQALRCSKRRLCKLVLRLACFSLPVAWFIVRKKWYAFILQDILGVFISVTAIRFLRLPSLKFATIFLVMFLLYDVFMVSVSPYVTKGCSIMTYVATGGFCNRSELVIGNPVWRESLPLVFLFPHVTPNSFQCLKFTSITSYPFSLYGIGDVVLPADKVLNDADEHKEFALPISANRWPKCHCSVVGFSCGYDLNCKVPYMLYFVVSSGAYALGTTVTYSIGRLLSTGQPALLYLVPSVLLPVHVIGLCRGEWKKLWVGDLSAPVVAACRADDAMVEAPSAGGERQEGDGPR